MVGFVSSIMPRKRWRDCSKSRPRRIRSLLLWVRRDCVCHLAMETAMRKLDVTGARYGMLVAIYRVEGERSNWLWQCDCGSTTLALLANVRVGKTSSCGCFRREFVSAKKRTHGHSVNRKVSKTLDAYYKARNRCTNPNDPRYSIYASRGLTMCGRWLEGFENFLEDMGPASKGQIFVRIDNEIGYSPDNCRWVTRSNQEKNKQQKIWVDYQGERMCLKDFTKKIGRNYETVRRRVQNHGEDPLKFAPSSKGI